MVWVCIALAIPLVFLLLLHFLRFHFHVSVESPTTLRGTVGVTFFRFRREVAVDAARAVWGHGEHDEDDEDDDDDDKAASAAAPASDASEAPGDGQRGALRIPDSWLRFADRLQSRLHKAATRWVLDPPVWRIFLRFGWKSGRRVVKLLHPTLEFLHLNLEDVFTLGRIASAWAVLSGSFPVLACPAEFGFARPFSLRARVGGGFTGLDLLVFVMMTLFSFPWAPLASRFVQCWRDPRLTRWQRRVLLP